MEGGAIYIEKERERWRKGKGIEEGYRQIERKG